MFLSISLSLFRGHLCCSMPAVSGTQRVGNDVDGIEMIDKGKKRDALLRVALSSSFRR
jgi:hypothetical protein